MVVWVLVIHMIMLNTEVYTAPVGAFSTHVGCEKFIQHEGKAAANAMCVALDVKTYP